MNDWTNKTLAVLTCISALQPFNVPEDLGIPIGGAGESNVYVLATHYNNEERVAGTTPSRQLQLLLLLLLSII